MSACRLYARGKPLDYESPNLQLSSRTNMYVQSVVPHSGNKFPSFVTPSCMGETPDPLVSKLTLLPASWEVSPSRAGRGEVSPRPPLYGSKLPRVRSASSLGTDSRGVCCSSRFARYVSPSGHHLDSSVNKFTSSSIWCPSVDMRCGGAIFRGFLLSEDLKLLNF